MFSLKFFTEIKDRGFNLPDHWKLPLLKFGFGIIAGLVLLTLINLVFFGGKRTLPAPKSTTPPIESISP
jgi:hypothetical protein